MSERAAFMNAIQKYGPQLDHIARRYGISGSALLAKLIQGESGFHMNRTSSAGAKGGAQFMPATRAAFIQRYGVDAWRSPEDAVHAATIYLKKSGVAAYNPGMPGYTQYVLGQKVGDVGGSRAGGGTGGSTTTTTTTPPQLHTDKLAALRDALLQGGKNPLIAAAQGVASGRYDSMSPGRTRTVTRATGGGGPASGGGPAARLAPGADRPGVKTNHVVLEFVGSIAPGLTIGTGSNHSRMTVDGNVSAHWTGNAADIPATGHRLIQLGHKALIRAGMPAAQAIRQTGGLFNVGGWQIIFNTHIGGDHTNHLHVGRRG
jgi:hypothetical protein